MIYVGITNRGTRRLHEHADSKPWWRLAMGCTLEHFETRDAALARERSLIETYRPPYNTQHNPEASTALDERVAKRLRGATPRTTESRSLKHHRRAWYELTSEQKLIAPCIECGHRPGITGPTCLPCRQESADH